ncbi:MAG: putative membrane protein, partial [Glaciecola sp.]
RWNSWDTISEPLHLLFDIGDRIINPFAHPRTWGVTLFMGLFLNIIYWSFKFISKRKL